MNVIAYILAIFIIVSLVSAVPLAFIWSLNTLFGLGIAYTFSTWAASLFILWVARRISPKIVSTSTTQETVKEK